MVNLGMYPGKTVVSCFGVDSKTLERGSEGLHAL